MTFRPLRKDRGGFQPLRRGRQAFAPLSHPVPGESEESAVSDELAADAAEEEASVAMSPGTHDDGYEAGYREGLAQARDEVGNTVEIAADLVKELQGVRARVFDGSRNDLIDLLAASLEWLHLASLEADQSLVVRVVDAVLEDFQEDQKISIHLNPQDQEALAAELSEGQKPWTTWDLTIVPDDSVGIGGCVVRAPEGNVQATVDERLARLQSEIELLRGADDDFHGGELG